ncbi:lipase family protein [Microbacterium sp. bgisy189]|uniref:lipase family protein n=1 Tax=Microbacterium sp. bgisy189 TaxID=3413798 RepID=UPI003EC09557
MRRTMAWAAAGVLTLSLLATSPATATTGSFYDPPADLPAANGELVRAEPMQLAASVSFGGSIAPLPGAATRIMYRTTDMNGAPAAASGVYIEPTVRWRGDGERPLVAFAAGTQGQGDACAPSKTLESGLVVESGAVAVGYEIPSIYGLLARGIAVVVTDYIGLGTTDRDHSYVVRLDSGHAVLDAARAADDVPGASVTASSPIGLFGYSQGGGAVASAAELAATYAPELPIKGTFAGAPPADLAAVLRSADGTSLTGVIGWALNGLAQYDAEFAAAVTPELNEKGVSTLEALKAACIGDAIITSGTAFNKTSSWTTSGESLSQLAARLPAVRDSLAEQRIGTMLPNAPVQILTGTKDDIVAHPQAKQLASDWCAQGVAVTYVPVIQPVGSGGTGLNHLAPMITRAALSQQWLVDRLEGDRTSGNCSSLRWLP